MFSTEEEKIIYVFFPFIDTYICKLWVKKNNIAFLSLDAIIH